MWIGEFRPISLVSRVYKIIAKVLPIRILGVLAQLIGLFQHAFGEGCQILDAVLIANEVVDL